MKYHRGFTLLELMIVLIVIGLFASMVVINSQPDRNKLIEREARQLFQLIQLAQDEAIMKGIEIGFNLSSTSYSFSVLSNDQWLPLDSDKQFSTHSYDADIDMQLRLTEESIIREVVKTENLAEPDVLLLSSGEITGFELSLSDKSDYGNPAPFTIIAQENGAINFYDRHQSQSQ